MYAFYIIAIGALFTYARTLAHVQEVTCDKLQYEMQTLRTVVKMEFEMGLMEKKMKEWESKMEEMIEKNNGIELKRDTKMEELVEKNNAIEIKRETKMEELIGTISQLKQDNEDLSKRLEDGALVLSAKLEKTNRAALDSFQKRFTELSTNISDERPASKTPQVAFTVHTPTGVLVDSIATFTHVVLNVGGGYKKDTGKFICPTAGLYQFAVTLLASSSRTSNVYCDIEKNGTTIGRAYNYEGRLDSASMVAAVHMSVGDVLGLHCKGWSNVYKGHHTVYTGLLINAE